ncbi:HCP-like protein [Lichtheimia hyalospora FSU 10163]|nr:HCP-like protein [Lichtheimia hyalospora FSU 10163]
MTPSSRSSSYVALPTSLNPDQLLDHSHLKPGAQASLLSYAQTINMYRENAKKTNSPEVQCDFAVFMVEAAKSSTDEQERLEYLQEAEKLLKQLSSRGHAESQYYLGNLYATGLISKKGKNEDKAFSLFVQATKHHHPDAAYRAAKCYEEGIGCRRDYSKAIQFYKKAATQNHPAAMFRLGMAHVNGEMSMSKNAREGVKWLKTATEAATVEFPDAVYELALLHEKGIDNVVFVDADYAVSLYARAAEDLNHAQSAFRLGQCYEYGKLNCKQDPALSIHYYTIAAQQGHREACFALTAWYLVGSPGILPQSDEQAYVWARQAAEKELPKAEYAVGYFTEIGMGTVKNPNEAMEWYKRAAEHGDKRAIQRLQGKVDGQKMSKKKNGDDCTIM